MTPTRPPLAIAHGGFDFAETLDVFAPLLADEGWRVVSWDQRGHGDSAWAHLYSWEADLRDAAAVIASLPPEPLPFVGHSKGGSLMMHLANMAPHRISALVNLDGLPSNGTMTDVSEHERTRRLRDEMDAWLAHRRTLVDKQRRPGTLDELAERRGRMNPRLEPRLAALPGHRRREPRRRRLALEARPDHAHGRVRAVAARVVDAAPARASACR